MARQSIKEQSINRLPTGLEGQNIPDDFMIPACSVEDVDRAVFNLFEKGLTHPLMIKENEGFTKVPVIFATGERFALVKRKKPIRDKNNMLILPLVSVRRTGINLAPANEYGLPGDVGTLTIKRKLSNRDSRYQNVINRLQLQNQSNVASDNNVVNSTRNRVAKPGRVGSRRNPRRSTAEAVDATSGRLLANNLGNNIYETLTIPFPKFYAASYEVTYWTQYTVHMNQMIENTISSLQPQGFTFVIRSDKGYYWVAILEEALTSGDNFEDFSSEERIVRYSFNLKVYSYFLANQNPGMPSPFRYQLSAPQINFGIFSINAPISVPGALTSDVGTGDINKFIMDKVEVLDNKGDPIGPGSEVVERVTEVLRDPFENKSERREVQVVTRNQRKGETVLRSRIIRKIDDYSF
jgi:hypothetical protein|tara:strand:- start:2094 stop:3320 length:1227 start_codon:yes stop_codon:yes gene_type:complete